MLNLKTDVTAPVWNLEVNGKEIGEEIARYVREIEYESADSIADMGSIRMVNPDNDVTDRKIFQPGNEVSVFAGYGTKVKHIGRFLIVRATPVFPQDGEPTVTIEGYSKDCLMMDREPPKSKDRVFKNMSFGEVVWNVAKRYGFEVDIDDPKTVQQNNIIQKTGTSDYAFIRGIANIVGSEMWTDGDKTGKWTLHFKHPQNMKVQDQTYKFYYNYMDESTLLSFQPELLIKGAKTKIMVKVKDRLTGKILETEVEEPNDPKAPNLDATIGPTDKLKSAYTTGAAITLQFGGFAFDVITNRRFTVESDVADWTKQWFAKMREKFILSQGVVIGVPDLRAFQRHYLENIGIGYSGLYQFSKVKHMINDNVGYVCEFGARKVLQ